STAILSAISFVLVIVLLRIIVHAESLTADCAAVIEALRHRMSNCPDFHSFRPSDSAPGCAIA
ncbi:hypothetical protein ACC731_37465, partial [Rhizobium ruizarguesonis]